MKRSTFVRSAGMGWLTVVALILTAFVLTPLFIKRLGLVTYGVWVLLNSQILYLSLLDLGLRNTITRFTALGYSRNQHDEVSLNVSAALVIRLAVGIAILFLSLVAAWALPHVFEVPAPLHGAARIALVLLGAECATRLIGGVFAGVLVGLQRSDLSEAMELVRILLSASATAVVLHFEYSLAVLAALQLATALLVLIVTFRMCRTLFPQLRITISRPDPVRLRLLWGFSSSVLLAYLSTQMIYATDQVILGIMASAAAVAVYSVATRIPLYVRTVTAPVTNLLMPIASRLDEKDIPARREFQLLGTRAVLLLALPAVFTLLLRGGTFLALWLDPAFALQGKGVLWIAAIVGLLAMSNETAYSLAMGLSLHRPIARWYGGAAALNVLLSVLLVRPFGVIGVALGGAIPMVFVHVVIFPRFISRMIDMPVLDYARKTWGPCLLCVIPFAIGCALVDRYWAAPSLMMFVAQTTALLPLAAIGLYAGLPRGFWRMGRDVAAPVSTPVSAPAP